MDNNTQTVLWGALGALGTAIAAYVGRLLLTPNEQLKQMSELVKTHSDMLQTLSDELKEVLIENKHLKERVKELENENHALHLKIEKLEKSDENNTRINKQARRVGS